MYRFKIDSHCPNYWQSFHGQNNSQSLEENVTRELLNNCNPHRSNNYNYVLYLYEAIFQKSRGTLPISGQFYKFLTFFLHLHLRTYLTTHHLCELFFGLRYSFFVITVHNKDKALDAKNQNNYMKHQSAIMTYNCVFKELYFLEDMKKYRKNTSDPTRT